MRSPSFIRRIGSFIDVMDSAIAVSNAVRGGRPARDADLIKLGIDPLRFREIKYR